MDETMMAGAVNDEMYRELIQLLPPPCKPRAFTPNDGPSGDANSQNESAFSAGPIRKHRRTRRIRAGERKTAPDTPPYVFVEQTDVTTAGDGNAAILYARIAYWHSFSPTGKRRLVSKDPFGEEAPFWTPGYRHIFEETGLSRDKARRALHNLTRKKLIEVTPGSEHDTFFRNGVRNHRLHIAFTEQHLQALLESGRLSPGNSNPGTCVQAANVRITATGNQAIVLSSIQPWFEPNRQGKTKLRVTRNGCQWRANSYDQLAEETGLSRHQVKRAVRGLRKAGYLIADHFFFRGKRVLHVRLDVDAMRSAWALRQQESESREEGGD